MLDFFTSKTGLFAAIAAVLGLGGTLWKLYSDFADRRERKEKKQADAARAAQGLALADLRLSELSLSSNSYELQFVITNSGPSKLVMRALRLRVESRRPCATPRESYTMAPLAVHKHQVRFTSDEDVYDVRKRTFGPGSEPLAFDPAEVEAFVVKLTSEETKLYVFNVEVEWYGAADPDKIGTFRSAALEAEFPERVSAGPYPGGR